jgi:two-component system OmpR family response regulator
LHLPLNSILVRLALAAREKINDLAVGKSGLPIDAGVISPAHLRLMPCRQVLRMESCQLSRHHILLVEDDADLAQTVASELQDRGYAATHAADGPGAVAAVHASPFDLLIVDRLLPGLDGITLIRQIRAENIHVPVLVLSSLSAVDDRVRGLKAGGDDYLTKPFALDELLARVEALLRRPRDTRESVLHAGELTMDLIDRSVQRRGRPIELLPREFKLLEYLMRRQGQLVTRAMLFEDVWNYRFAPHSNLVDVHIGKLRRKIDVAGQPPLIESITGSGFILRAPD